MWPAFFYDGRTADRESVNVSFVPGGLRLERADGTSMTWPISQVRQTQGAFSKEQVRLEHGTEPVQVLFVDQRGFVEAVRERFPESRAAWKQRSTTGRLLALGAGGLAIAAALYVWGAPVLADWLAPRVPAEWETAMGESVAERMAPKNKVCTAPELESLRGILDRMLATGAGSAGQQFRMVVLYDTSVNAFAAPGGFIAVHSGLLTAARTPEEFAGVLAHEISHVTRHHSTRAIIREMPLRLAIAAVAGGSGMESAAQVAGSLGALRYRRGDEVEADVEGMKLIQAARIDPRGTVDIMRTLETKGTSVPRFATYLSSHPHTADRVAGLERLAAQARYEPTPLLSADAWSRVQDACRVNPNARVPAAPSRRPE
jgi:predicted Zn-dependent protease